ncbi:Sodium/hydrogen exchanger family-domain-containing protein [Staphylotrichum tortipilum]|uniref:Sodium/hydrogen exchanger n=1 Tax=Staphylotrichum tortipilum TaxID=2831512 RepID=A0AAN6MRK1_9PEZI|nr:Sodium/hydrogen exchanger family-domain-containing protein [Staphylotrichum longicolle]
MLAETIVSSLVGLARREEEDPAGADPPKQENNASWAIFILIMLLIVAFCTSYTMQQRKITAIHETVVSIFGGMTVGLILRVSGFDSIRDLVNFNYQYFFNLLLPPIILSSGYELHQANFFRNIGTILTFAFAGTFISAVVIGVLLWLYTAISLEGLDVTWVDAISVGATLSATDPVTILAIFNTFKVDPKLYTIIFGESILNDAVAIVIFESAQSAGSKGGGIGVWSVLHGIWYFLSEFFGSLAIGAMVGVLTALGLKYTYVRRYPSIESSLVVLIAYATYFFAQAIGMSGIVALLFCGITLKHYAYFNMSRRTQLTTKYFFQVTAQLSENFIFIYLGLALFTEKNLVYQPLLIIVTVLAVCAARWLAVFPLSKLINWFIRYRARRQGREAAEELPYSYQAMLFWAGLRGAVGVALSALFTAKETQALQATVLVVVVLTVIIFGGTTARMLEIMGIRTGVTEELDSDDEFDIEAIGSGLYKRSDTAIGYNPRRNASRGSALQLGNVGGASSSTAPRGGDDGNGWASGHRSPNTAPRQGSRSRRGGGAAGAAKPGDEFERSELLGPSPGSNTDSEFEFGSDIDISDLPPPAPGAGRGRRTSPILSPEDAAAREAGAAEGGNSTVAAGATGSVHGATQPLTATAAIRQLFSTEDPSALFRQLDEDYIKPTLLLDGGGGSKRGREGIELALFGEG